MPSLMNITQLSILCMVKNKHQEAFKQAEIIKEYFASFDVGVHIVSVHEEKAIIQQLSQSCQLVLVLGGDGTMLSAVRSVDSEHIPFFGINYGTVGFLTEANPKDWKYWCNRLYAYLQEKYHSISTSEDSKLFIDKHSLIYCTVERNNEIIFSSTALNDAVVARSVFVRAVSLALYIDEDHLSTLRCDGLIISTAIGATAYAIAANGPLALPGLNAHIITPISPFAGAFPPCVVSSSSKINITVEEKNTPTILTLDGQDNFNLEYKDKIEISSHKNKMSLLISDKSWYTKRLVNRGYIQQGPGIQPNANK